MDFAFVPQPGTDFEGRGAKEGESIRFRRFPLLLFLSYFKGPEIF